MEVDRKSKDQEEAHLSDIRGLVKRLNFSQEQQHEVQQPKKLQRGSLKKQVRRRLHATRPYQERLFNTAEARREIVAALKLHRASMKQANDTQSMAATSTLQGRFHELVVDSIRNSINHPPDRALAKYFHASPFLPTNSSSPFSLTYQLNFHLPDQPLGLNLNLQTFQNLDISIYHSIHNPTPAEPSSSQALLSSCSNSSPNAMPGTKQSSHVAFDPSSIALHRAIDEEEMAEIQSIGEPHEIEWNDKMNLSTSAWWSKFLKSMEGSTDEGQHRANENCIYALGETLDTPYRLNGGVGEDAKESSLSQQHLDDYFHVDDYLQDATLESLDAGELNMEENDYYSKIDNFDKGHLITAPSN